MENPTGLQGVPTDATKQSTRIPKCFHKGQLNLWRPCLVIYGLLMRAAVNWSISTQIRERRRQQLIQPSGCHRAPERHLDGSPDRSFRSRKSKWVAVDDLLCICIWNFHTPMYVYMYMLYTCCIYICTIRLYIGIKENRIQNHIGWRLTPGMFHSSHCWNHVHSGITIIFPLVENPTYQGTEVWKLCPLNTAKFTTLKVKMHIMAASFQH